MIAEILSVGTELLMGQIANTDAQYISRRLSELGITLYRHTTVGDNPARVKEALNETLSRSDIVITTGGLGPTEDDLTKEMVAEYFGLEMRLDAPSLEAIERAILRGGHPMTDNNRKQAYFPEGAFIMPNRCGTAPGCVVEADGKAVAVLPGPPHELQDMFECQLAPWLARRSGAHIESRFLRVFGIGESSLEVQLLDLFHSDNPTLALYCGPGEVQARITAMAPDSAAALDMIAPVEAEIRRRLGRHVYGEGRDLSIERAAFRLLQARRETLCVAETGCTGGLLASRLSALDESAAALIEARAILTDDGLAALGVDPKADPLPAAEALATALRQHSGADWAIAVAGSVKPEGGAFSASAGIAVAGPDGVAGEARAFRGTRAYLRTLCASWALNLLRLRLEA
ncbi:MAG: CinA family nicotinamide mononucleotide deamidase-related protein [Clostridia bacterium]|nr:CinA family nicotinamide mononucleotide deamidase-related protein [Clostridia bacterium]